MFLEEFFRRERVAVVEDAGVKVGRGNSGGAGGS
jgi:hypothetical protein